MPKYVWLGFGVLAFAIVSFVCHYGQHWTLGRYGMPSALVTPQGTYLDGSEIDPVSRAIISTGREEECYLAALIVLIILGAIVVREMRRLQRMRREAFGCDFRCEDERR